MPLEDAGVSTRVVRPVLAGLAVHGLDPAPHVHAVGLDPEEVANPDARLPHGTVIELWNRAVEVTGNPAFGLRVAEVMDFSQFGVQGYAFLTAPTLGDGLQAILRFHRLTHDAARVTLEMSSDEACYRHTLPAEHRLPAAAAQFVMAVPVLAARVSTGRVAARSVRFQHPAPADRSDYDRVLGVPVTFSQPHNEVVFPREALALPHQSADPALRAILERHGEAILAATPRMDNFADRVRSMLAEELQGGNPSADHIANRLRMSTRTLGRRLRDLGTSHRELLEQLRRNLAERYLGDLELSIGEVAFLLGYSEPSAFHRAFKRWTGLTPAEVRAHRPS